jgi:general secretion pathway protein G
MLLTTTRRSSRSRALARRAGFTLLEVLVVVAILVILATIATIATTRYIEDARKTKAQLGCKALSDAVKSYINNPANPQAQPPNGLQDLKNPFFGGTSFLNGGDSDLVDPWGQQYQFTATTMPDGSQGFLVHTQSKDNPPVPISQYGIGPASQPPSH